MNLDQIKDLSARDASLYFNDCVATHRKEIRTCLVNIVEADTPRGWAVRKSNQTLPPEDFFSEWEVTRFSLGWRNIGTGAVYLSSPVGRGASKGYRPRAVYKYSPYDYALKKKRSHIYLQLKDELEQAESINEEQLRDLEAKAIKNVNLINSKINQDVDRVMSSGPNRTKAAFPTYVSVPDAINAIKTNNITGAALANSIALVLDGRSDSGGPTLYYHKIPIGEVQNEQLNCYDEYKDMVPQITRILGEQRNVS